MKYISIGAVMTEGTEHILDVCRGSRSYHLTGELASVWLNGRFGFAAVKKPTEEQALLLLLRMGLAIQTDGSGFEEYRALTQCTLVPADRKHPYWGLTGMERAVLQWLREAGLVLSMAELTYLIDQKVPLQADLLGNANTQNLVEQIYTRDTIDDGILEGQMERSNAREPVTKEKLAKAFSELSLMRREVLRLLFVEEKTPCEIARQLCISPNCVYQFKHQALAKLKRELTKGDGLHG